LYYHVKIQLNKEDELSELDKNNIDEIKEEIILPYLNQEDFFFDGQELNKNKIRSLKIYETSETSQYLADFENNKPSQIVYYFSKKDVIKFERYSTDITNRILKETKKIMTKKDELNVEKAYDKKKIFIVHGHDAEAKLEVARFIDKIGFESIILHEQVNKNQTIIEKIETYTDVGFGVVIYTPCDVGAMKSESKNLNQRARQNVVFEHGFLLGKLGRSNVCSLVKGKVETPSDISGVVYTPMDSGNWQIELAKELKASGYNVDMNKVI